MHVDNRQICTSGLSTIGHIRTALTKSFDMILQDKVNQLVGVKIEQCVDRVFFSQPVLIWSSLEDNDFLTSYVATPMVSGQQLLIAGKNNLPLAHLSDLSIIGSLGYLEVSTRPDIAFTVNHLARVLTKPRILEGGETCVAVSFGNKVRWYIVQKW